MKHSKKTIEEAYTLLLEKQAKKKSNNIYTGRQAVVALMLEKPEKIWWWSWEFVGKTTQEGEFLSHRAPARASDLAIHYPELVEDRKIGRYSVYRLKLENKKQITNFLLI